MSVFFFSKVVINYIIYIYIVFYQVNVFKKIKATKLLLVDYLQTKQHIQNRVNLLFL